MTEKTTTSTSPRSFFQRLNSLEAETRQWTQKQHDKLLEGVHFAQDDKWKAHPYASPQTSPVAQGEEACRVLSLGHPGVQIESTLETVAFGKLDGRKACMVVVKLRFIYHHKEGLIERALVRLNFGTEDKGKAGPPRLVPSESRLSKLIDFSQAKALNPKHTRISMEVNSQDLTTSYPRATSIFGPFDVHGEIKTEQDTTEAGASTTYTPFSFSGKKTVVKTKEDRWQVTGVKDSDRPCYSWTFYANGMSTVENFPRSLMVGAIVEHDETEFYCDVSVGGLRKGTSDWHIDIDRRQVRPIVDSQTSLTETMLQSITSGTNLQAVPVKATGKLESAAEPAVQTTTIHVEHQNLVQYLVQHQNVAILPSGQVVEGEKIVPRISEASEGNTV